MAQSSIASSSTSTKPKCRSSMLSMMGSIIIVLQLYCIRLGYKCDVSTRSSLQDNHENQHQSPISSALQQQQKQRSTLTKPMAKENNNSNNTRKQLKSQQQHTINNDVTIEATFNTMGLYFQESNNMHSTVHCVGNNHQPHAWIYQSCQFRNLCFDLDEREYVLFQDPYIEQKLATQASRDPSQEAQRHAKDPSYVYLNSEISSIMTNVNVSIGGINPKWTDREHGIPRLQWFPKIIQEELTTGYYTFEDPDLLWVPFHSIAGWNPGHLVWDEFLPIFTLLAMFDLLDKSLLLTRYTLHPALWATCDAKEKNVQKCSHIYKKFLPLMGVDPAAFSTRDDFTFELLPSSKTQKQQQRKSKYVCAPYGASGIGMLTDHGKKQHGWEKKDFQSTHNHGRGAVLHRFRDYLMNNVGITSHPVNAKRPHKIAVSILSSTNSLRRKSFKKQIKALQGAFTNDEAIVTAYQLDQLTLEEQIKVADGCSIFITVCGGGAVTAQFLPKGASLILFYGTGITNNRLSRDPAPLDWDLFNNRADIRTHWLPSNVMDDQEAIDELIQLIKHEFDMIHHL